MTYQLFLQAGGGLDPSFFLMLGAMFVVMYFFIIRPQMQKQKKEKKFQEELKSGAQIVTTSGIHGKVSDVNGDVIMIETNAGKLRIERSAISREMTDARYGKKEEKK